MLISQYEKWSKEIREQKDIIVSVGQYQRMCDVFVQDVWLDIDSHQSHAEIKAKSVIMFNLQGHFSK